MSVSESEFQELKTQFNSLVEWISLKFENDESLSLHLKRHIKSNELENDRGISLTKDGTNNINENVVANANARNENHGSSIVETGRLRQYPDDRSTNGSIYIKYLDDQTGSFQYKFSKEEMQLFSETQNAEIKQDPNSSIRIENVFEINNGLDRSENFIVSRPTVIKYNNTSGNSAASSASSSGITSGYMVKKTVSFGSDDGKQVVDSFTSSSPVVIVNGINGSGPRVEDMSQPKVAFTEIKTAKNFPGIASLLQVQHQIKKPKQYICNVCQKNFPSSSNLAQHKKSHKPEKSYACKYCNKCFKWKNGLISHLPVHTGENRFICKICTKYFASSSNLSRHKRTIHHIRKSSTVSGTIPHAVQFNAMENNMPSKSKKSKKFQCKVCKQIFSGRTNLWAHTKIYHTDTIRPIVCNICNKRFTFNHNRIAHQRTHTGEKPYLCEFCSKQFAWLGSLKQHQHIHTGKKHYYQCKVCPMEYSCRSSLYAHHQKNHNGKKGKPFPCKEPNCTKSYMRLGHLKGHILISHRTIGEKNQRSAQNMANTSAQAQSNSQNQNDSNNSSLNEIMAADITLQVSTPASMLSLSPEVRENNINESGKANNENESGQCQISALNSTEETPKNDRKPLKLKLHICNICQKVFAHSSNLNVHKRLHEDIQERPRPHECESCGKYFSTKGNLKVHKIIHILKSGEQEEVVRRNINKVTDPTSSSSQNLPTQHHTNAIDPVPENNPESFQSIEENEIPGPSTQSEPQPINQITRDMTSIGGSTESITSGEFSNPTGTELASPTEFQTSAEFDNSIVFGPTEVGPILLPTKTRSTFAEKAPCNIC